MFFDIEHNLCEMYHGLSPLSILDYPAEDVFNLINNACAYQKRNSKSKPDDGKIRRKANDTWF